jgi:hypothetical protein
MAFQEILDEVRDLCDQMKHCTDRIEENIEKMVAVSRPHPVINALSAIANRPVRSNPGWSKLSQRSPAKINVLIRPVFDQSLCIISSTLAAFRVSGMRASSLRLTLFERRAYLVLAKGARVLFKSLLPRKDRLVGGERHLRRTGALTV